MTQTYNRGAVSSFGRTFGALRSGLWMRRSTLAASSYGSGSV